MDLALLEFSPRLNDIVSSFYGHELMVVSDVRRETGLC